MPAQRSALLSVSRVGAFAIGLFYGAIHKGTLESKVAKEAADRHAREHHGERVPETGHGVMARSAAETGASINPQESTIPGHH